MIQISEWFKYISFITLLTMNALYIPKPNGLLLTHITTTATNILTTYRQAINDTIAKIQSLEPSE